MENETTSTAEFVKELKIRTAVEADIPFLVEFNARMAEETEGLHLDRERLRCGVEAVLANPSRGVYYVAAYNGTVVGQLLLTYEWSDWRNGVFWWIQSVYVVPEFRRKKVFTSLYRFVESLAQSDPSVCGLRLYVEKNNERATAVYTALGMHLTHYHIMEKDFVLKKTS